MQEADSLDSLLAELETVTGLPRGKRTIDGGDAVPAALPKTYLEPN